MNATTRIQDDGAAAPNSRISPEPLVEVLFAPIDFDTFVSRYLGREAYHFRGRAGRFAELFSWHTLNRILSEHRLHAPRLRLVRNGELVAEQKYITYESNRRGFALPRITPEPFIAELSSGATLVLDGIDEISLPARALAEVLERRFHERIHINAYAAWRESNGFDVHWDDHDVLVLQLYGRKTWNVYGETKPHPVTRSVNEKEEPPRHPLWTCVLEDGDCLYLPRGWWHMALPRNEPTLHLTCGIAIRTGLNLLEWLVGHLAAVDRYREDLPRFADLDTQTRHIRELKAALDAAWDSGILSRYLADTDAQAAPRSTFELPDIVYAERPLDSTDVVVLNSPRAISNVIREGNGGLHFRANGRSWQLPEHLGPVLDQLLTGDGHTLENLCAHAGDGVSHAQVEEAVRSLWVSRLVTRMP